MNWFKRKEKMEQKQTVVEMIASPIIVKKSYPKEVIQIHNEFEIAGELLLKEALCVLEKASTTSFEKAKRLLSLGFKQAQEAKDGAELMKKIEVSQETADLVRYYQLQYPNNKFITEEQVKIICYKYNLVCGDINRFKGFVPEKNLKEIENFKVKDNDISITGVCWDSIGPRIKFSISLEEFEKAKKLGLLRGKKSHLDIKTDCGDERWFESNDLSTCLGRDVPKKYFDRVVSEKLQICAPIKDMDISDLELKDGYKLEKKFIPDPIVLQPVKNGYLIITAWGDEASDENVVNQQMN